MLLRHIPGQHLNIPGKCPKDTNNSKLIPHRDFISLVNWQSSAKCQNEKSRHKDFWGKKGNSNCKEVSILSSFI